MPGRSSNMIVLEKHSGKITFGSQCYCNEGFNTWFAFPRPGESQFAKFLHIDINATTGMLGLIGVFKGDFKSSAYAYIKFSFHYLAIRIRPKPFKNKSRIGPGFPYIYYGSTDGDADCYRIIVHYLYYLFVI